MPAEWSGILAGRSGILAGQSPILAGRSPILAGWRTRVSTSGTVQRPGLWADAAWQTASVHSSSEAPPPLYRQERVFWILLAPSRVRRTLLHRLPSLRNIDAPSLLLVPPLLARRPSQQKRSSSSDFCANTTSCNISYRSRMSISGRCSTIPTVCALRTTSKRHRHLDRILLAVGKPLQRRKVRSGSPSPLSSISPLQPVPGSPFRSQTRAGGKPACVLST